MNYHHNIKLTTSDVSYINFTTFTFSSSSVTLHEYDKAGYTILDPSEGHMHFVVIVLGWNGV